MSLLDIDISKTAQVALRSEIEEGEATVLCNIDGETSKEYSIEIQKIFLNNNSNNKSFVIKVTDEELLSETRGNN